MSDGGRAEASSAAKRRRERRLRAAWRHVHLSVRMALAAEPLSSEECWACDARCPTGTDDSKGGSRPSVLHVRR